MNRRVLPTPRLPRTWTYAIIGGLISMPLTIGQYWLSGMGSHFSTNLILLGGLLAGYLAERNSAAAGHAGLGAGVIGGVPGYVWIFPAMVETAASFSAGWSSPVAGTIVMGVMGVLVICTAGLPGLLGGIAGGWLAKKVTIKRRPVSSI